MGNSAEALVPNEPESQTNEVAARAQSHGTSRVRLFAYVSSFPMSVGPSVA
jgi:hypothetical protein